jgi:hypothetical protein
MRKFRQWHTHTPRKSRHTVTSVDNQGLSPSHLPSQTVTDAVTTQDSIRIGDCPILTGYYFNVNADRVEWFRVARALGERLALAVMSKSNPTLFNVPYYYGTCKFFLKVFQGRQGNGWQGKLMAEKWRQKNGSIGD